jgi:hypothetical protein
MAEGYLIVRVGGYSEYWNRLGRDRPAGGQSRKKACAGSRQVYNV